MSLFQFLYCDMNYIGVASKFNEDGAFDGVEDDNASAIYYLVGWSFKLQQFSIAIEIQS